MASSSKCQNMADNIQFLRRQEQFQRAREEKLAKLANETRCSFSPELSKRTQTLSQDMRSKPIGELLHLERARRQRKLEKCIGQKLRGAKSLPASPREKSSLSRQSTCSDPKMVCVFDDPEKFRDLLLELQAQEQRMIATSSHR